MTVAAVGTVLVAAGVGGAAARYVYQQAGTRVTGRAVRNAGYAFGAAGFVTQSIVQKLLHAQGPALEQTLAYVLLGVTLLTVTAGEAAEAVQRRRLSPYLVYAIGLPSTYASLWFGAWVVLYAQRGTPAAASQSTYLSAVTVAIVLCLVGLALTVVTAYRVGRRNRAADAAVRRQAARTQAPTAAAPAPVPVP